MRIETASLSNQMLFPEKSNCQTRVIAKAGGVDKTMSSSSHGKKILSLMEIDFPYNRDANLQDLRLCVRKTPTTKKDPP